MRYILASLLVLNLAYFTWQWMLNPGPEDLREPGRVDSTIPRIVLLEEREPSQGRQAEMGRVVKNPIIVGKERNAGCKALGPFPGITVAQAAAERLQSRALKVELRAIDKPAGEYDYRVMIPPAPSLEDAFRKLRELQSQKIDSYVITQGEDALGISLGVYSTREAAGRVSDELAGEGYDVEIRKISRFDRQYWIFSADAPDLSLDEESLNGLVAGYPAIDLQDQPCIRITSMNTGSLDTDRNR